ncbi:MAG: hypothetical protein E7601_04245 [Ruminococcaceae bacterium]|nr:hypothetical protein [Oscillospiraceae bacterium]
MKIIRKTLSILLIVAMLCPMLASCGNKFGTPIMKLGDVTISENMLEFWLSRYKAYFVQYYMDGKDNASFWEETVPGSTKTWNETFTEFIVDNAKTYLAALYLFDELGLSISKAVQDEIDEEIEELLEGQADGNKKQFNEILSQYGVNMDILAELYLIEKKIEFLQQYLYGDNGIEKISESVKTKYYEDNYARMKHIFLYTGKRPIVKENGEYEYDDQGYVKYRTMTAAEDKEVEDRANTYFKALTPSDPKDAEDFDDLLLYYGEDIAARDEYPNGFYFTESSTYFKEVIKALFEMEVGEYRMVKSDSGIHIIKKLALEDKGYAIPANTDFFTDFENNLISKTFNARLEEYKKLIEIDTERLASYCLRDANANYTY